MEGEKARTPTLLGTLDRVGSSLVPTPEDGSRASFRNVMNFNFNIFNNLLFGRWIKSIKPTPHKIYISFMELMHTEPAYLEQG
jgi:hypothetical protein